MEVLSVGGKDYVKASVIARDLGYTADYVGQLCRSRKVNAKLVGRSWYVDRNSIHLHKTNRYRSTQTKTKEALASELRPEKTDDDVTYKVPLRTTNFYAHNRIKKTDLSYATDDAELIPVVKKQQEKPVMIPVELADAVPVKIESTGAKYIFNTPSVPKIKFKGALTVTNYEDEEPVDPEARVIHPKAASHLEKIKMAKNIDSSPVERKGLHHSLEGAKLARTQRLQKSKVKTDIQSHEKGSDPVTHLEVDQVQTSTKSNWGLFLSVTVSSLVIVVGLLGMEARVLIDDQTVNISYSFVIENLKLTASVYDSVADMRGIVSLAEFSTNFFIF